MSAAQRFGFRSGDRGTHGSRSILLADLRQLLAATAADAAYEDYRRAIMEDNVLGKGTASTRLNSWKKLRELYGLDPRLAVFRCFRELWDVDAVGRPLLAVLCACARDPLLRLSAMVVLGAPVGTVLCPQDFVAAIHAMAPQRFSVLSLKAIGNRTCSSWTQSGHLAGDKVRIRTHPVASPEAVVYALLLGRLTGARGPGLFNSFWTAVVDAPSDSLLALATTAAQRGWIDLRRAGAVVDVSFPRLLTAGEMGALRESD
ncbi:MAG: hypothetical protein IPJ58_07325 [Ardenticatenia bacterium]|nr:hypothetical protein [Ardenticatenia bacterium]